MFFSVAVLTIASCNNETDEMFAVQDEQMTSQDSVFTYDMYFDSEIIPYGGTSRATMTNDWEDGDEVYLYFGGTNDTYGKAEYISASKKWEVTCENALANETNAICHAWFSKGFNQRNHTSSISYDYATEAYYSDGGSYTYSGNSIYVNITMNPIDWRLRFKGTVGTIVRVQETAGFSHYYYMYKTRELLYSTTTSFSLTVGSNGYTDYFVGKANSSCTNITITNENTGESFTHYFDINTLMTGESGYFTIPTSTDLHGWYATENGHAYVDLDLPSGTKWATCNVGATKPEDYGGYYAWGETEEKDYYGWDNYIHCDGTQNSCHNIGDNIAGSEYDVAHLRWGGTWQMPSLDQIKELIDNCSSLWTKLNDVNGILITGPNGNTIFLPAAGNYRLSEFNYLGVHGGYWSSSPYTSTKGFSYYLYFDKSSWNWNNQYNYRYYGRSVRAVIP